MEHTYEEEAPLLDDRPQSYSESVSATGGEESVDTKNRGGATVNCRVCDAQIDLEGRTNQHVVKCASCQEATPIRPAPPGKKYVRCPCNCLLICKAASTRIACPRTNCRRVITLGHREPQGSAVRAPTGSCRVSCVHCHEVFLFNTLTNSLANCPHCKHSSSVGGLSEKRARNWLYATLVTVVFSAVFLWPVVSKGQPLLYVIWAGFLVATLACFGIMMRYRFFTKTSTVLGAI